MPPCAHSDPNIGGGECRRVIYAIANHHYRAVLALGQHDQHFLIRCQLRPHGVDAEASRDGFRNLAPVAGRENDPLYSQFSESLQKRLRPLTQFIGKHDLARHLSINRYSNDDGTNPLRSIERIACLRGQSGSDEMDTTDNHIQPVNAALDALARRLDQIGRGREIQLAIACLGHKGLRNDMLRCLIERGRKSQHLIGSKVTGDADRYDPRSAVGQRSCLVDDERIPRTARYDPGRADQRFPLRPDHRSGETIASAIPARTETAHPDKLRDRIRR